MYEGGTPSVSKVLLILTTKLKLHQFLKREGKASTAAIEGLRVKFPMVILEGTSVEGQATLEQSMCNLH